MKEMIYQVRGEGRVAQGCVACTQNGNCRDSRNFQTRVYNWGTAGSKQVDLTFRGWEDDHGDRCSHSGSAWWRNDDDCHQS